MTAVLVSRNKAPLPGIVNEFENITKNSSRSFTCRKDAETEAGILIMLASIAMMANTLLMIIIIIKSKLRRWSQGLVFHQALVDLLRSSLLFPLAASILNCHPITKCSLLETSFLVLVTASTINLLTTVLNDAPVLPDDNEEDAIPILMDSPQCVGFGIFIIWFASITINLGPTFLSGTMAANANTRPVEPSCPLVQGPYRHYILNFLWISVNIVCILLTLYHLVKLYRDFSKTSPDAIRVATLVTSIIHTDSESEEVGKPLQNGDAKRQIMNPEENLLNQSPNKPRVLYADPVRVKKYLNKMEREGIARVKMFLVITISYLIFWGPLFLVTLIHWDWQFEQAKQSMAHEVTLHVALVHSFVNPSLFLVLHRGLRQGALELLCYSWTYCCRNDNFKKLVEKRKIGANIVSAENKGLMKKSSTNIETIESEAAI